MPSKTLSNRRPLTPEGYLEVINHISHDLRNPLCVISEYSALLREGIVGPLSTEQRQIVDVVGARVDEIQLLVDALLTISRLNCGHLHLEPVACPVEVLLSDAVLRLQRNSAARQLQFEL